MNARFFAGLVDGAAASYRPAGRFAWRFARGKLAGDPVFRKLLEQGLIPEGANLLDLGCGQGLLAAWLFAARSQFETGAWPPAWPRPPRLAIYRGIELMPADARRARTALGSDAEIVTGDIRVVDLGNPDTIVILDVLHFITREAQEHLLRRIHASLAAEGSLLLRVGDADGGLGFRFGLWVDSLVAFLRGHGLPRFHCRPSADWEALLRRLGFVTERLPMDQGTFFANTLFIARTSPPDASPAG